MSWSQFKYRLKILFQSNRVKNFVHQNWLEIDSGNLLENFDCYSTLASNIFPVLKSNAYGLGIKEVATILKSRKFPYIVVDGLFEAEQIASISNQKILVMSYIDPCNFNGIDLTNISLVVQSIEILEALSQLKSKVRIHLEINSGMNRWGILPQELDQYIEFISNHPNIELEGVMSHLANSDSPDNSFTKEQTKVFDKCCKVILTRGFKPKYFHLGQSAGSVKAKSEFANTLRVGIGLYGYNPLEEQDNEFSRLQNLKPTAILKSKIIKVHKLKKGDKVGYGCTWQAIKTTNVAVIPMGYYEGLDRRLSNGIGQVKIASKFYPIAGRVCMNITMIDLGQDDYKIGQEVEIFSQYGINSVQSTSQKIATIPYTILVGISPFVFKVIR